MFYKILSNPQGATNVLMLAKTFQMDNGAAENNFTTHYLASVPISDLSEINTASLNEGIYITKRAERATNSIPLQKSINQIIKFSFDYLISVLIILGFFSWMLPIIAILIKLDSRGPVFFLQKRNKKNGREFLCIKFRSMVVNKDADTLAAYENDERITKLGKFLRRYYLDELPQLFNVIAGDMSLIGPRPYMIKENQQFETTMIDYSVRHWVKPGITGLAQSNGYSGSMKDLDHAKERIKFDLTYVYYWSFGLDCKILFNTLCLMIGLKKKNHW